MSRTLAAFAATAATLLLCACGAGTKPTTVSPAVGGKIPAKLLAGERPIGRGPRFQPAATGPILGSCESSFGTRDEAHIEVFGANQVVLLPKGLGTGAPRHFLEGRLTHADCFGELVTVDQTGTVYFRKGSALTLADLFRSWGQPLSVNRVASFTGGHTTVYVSGRLWDGRPGAVPLTDGAEIVVEIGPHVPPHQRFVFLPMPSAGLR